MKAIVIGCGWMGTAVAWAMHKLGYELALVEPDGNRREEAQHKFKSLGMPQPTWCAFPDYRWSTFPNRDVDVVVSCAPYRSNLDYAKNCRVYGFRYCDLGGNPEVSQAIKQYALENKNPTVFTDLGLAPGYINILAEEVAEKVDRLYTINLYVGGLPQEKQNRIGYNMVFSVDGLLNEYTGECDILHQGRIQQVLSLRGVQRLGAQHEAFYTRGGIGSTLESMKVRGVANCSYRTIRYAGHCEYVRFLMEDSGLYRKNTEFTTTLRDIFTHACPPTKDDLVHMLIKYAILTKQGQLVSTIKSNESWTAMQIGTAFPAAAVAAMMAKGRFDDKSVATYADVNVAKCKELLRTIDSDVPWDLQEVPEGAGLCL